MIEISTLPAPKESATLPEFNTETTPLEPTDIRLQPAYSVNEAARLLWLNPSTLRSWVAGRDYPAAGEQRRFRHLIVPPSGGPVSLSFINLVEAHVLSALRRQHKLDLGKIRQALDYLRLEMGSERPLVEHRFETDGIDLFVEHLGHLVAVTAGGQTTMREMISSYLTRIEWGRDGLATRFFPFTRTNMNANDPKMIVVDPVLSFGRPSIRDTGISAEIVAERYQAGESVDLLSSDYGCGRDQIEEAVRCALALAA